MVEFNADGSLKLPGKFAEAKRKDEQRFANTNCLKVTKEVVSTYSPKKCLVRVELSPRFSRNDFIQNIFQFFSWQSETPIKLLKQNERKFHFEIGSSFRRCSECTSLIGRYREYNDGNMIVKKRGCTYNPHNFFSQEDYFD